MFCKNCGIKLKDGELFCPECGTKQEIIATNKENPDLLPKSKQNKKTNVGKPGKKPIIIVAILGIAVIVALVVLLAIKGGSSKISKSDFVLYSQSDELYIDFLAEETTKRLTSNMNSDDFYYEGSASIMTVFNENTGNLFFPDKCNSDGISLYYINLNEKSEKRVATKIDTNVTRYTVTENGEYVYYITSNNVLYRHDLTDKVKISSDVYSLFMNDTCDVIVYSVANKSKENWTYSYYSVDSKNNSTLLIDGATYPYYTNNDETVLAVFKGETIFTITDGKNVNQLATVSIDDEDEVAHVLYADSSKAYYYVSRNTRYNVADYITDTNRASDANTKKPDKNDTKYWKTWEEGWLSTYATEYTNQYYAELERYELKEERDRIRNNYIDDDLHLYVYPYELYYCYGTESVLLTDRCKDSNAIDGKLIYSVYDISENKPDLVDISEHIDSLSDSNISDYVTSVVNTGISYYVAIDGNTNLIATKNREFTEDEPYAEFPPTDFDIGFDSVSSAVYFIKDCDTNGVGDLYKKKISGSKLGAEELIYTDVGCYMFDNANNILTFRDCIINNSDDDISSNDLYLNDKLIDTDVYGNHGYSSNYMPVDVAENNTLTYMIAFSGNDYSGTLRQYDGKDAKTIANDMRYYYVLDTDKIFYISDFTSSSYSATGTLYYYLNGNTIMVDDYVEYMIEPASH